MSLETILEFDSWEDLEYHAFLLQKSGWELRTSRFPLYGQEGILCTKLNLGDLSVTEKSLVVNLFETKLIPIEYPLFSEKDLLTFLWSHGRHDLNYFETTQGEVGLVCYCSGQQGKAHAIIQKENRLSKSFRKIFEEYKCQHLR